MASKAFLARLRRKYRLGEYATKKKGKNRQRNNRKRPMSDKQQRKYGKRFGAGDSLSNFAMG